MITEAAQESSMTASERPESTNISSKKIKSPLNSQNTSKKKVNRFSIRRSERIQNSTSRSVKIQNVIEEITLSESDEEDEMPTNHEKSLPPLKQEKDRPELMMKERKFEGKLDYIVKLFEAHGHTLDSIKTEVIKRSFPMETIPTPEMNYKNMYIASQKKIEELAEENRVLTQKLENALDRYEAVCISNFTYGAIAMRTAPIPYLDAPVSTLNHMLKLGKQGQVISSWCVVILGRLPQLLHST
ncbi:titin-like isoform X2 [Cucumis melo var. makuwa]|uniref:Titin-like isoform X2 n=1 Tax=Cucumis melo var. makuwa TaxID=1194695 RepID=A0A5A7V7I6_CUCMM|nr:titin-like isoform X2 [Cucumis melo var. makuwa]TYK18498.1 titin-like isoform X2 [Cucumis melo var. makuwa]